jgi:hypothetical protein
VISPSTGHSSVEMHAEGIASLDGG